MDTQTSTAARLAEEYAAIRGRVLDAAGGGASTNVAASALEAKIRDELQTVEAADTSELDEATLRAHMERMRQEQERLDAAVNNARGPAALQAENVELQSQVSAMAAQIEAWKMEATTAVDEVCIARDALGTILDGGQPHNFPQATPGLAAVLKRDPALQKLHARLSEAAKDSETALAVIKKVLITFNRLRGEQARLFAEAMRSVEIAAQRTRATRAAMESMVPIVDREKIKEQQQRALIFRELRQQQRRAAPAASAATADAPAATAADAPAATADTPAATAAVAADAPAATADAPAAAADEPAAAPVTAAP